MRLVCVSQYGMPKERIRKDFNFEIQNLKVLQCMNNVANSVEGAICE